MFIRFEKIVPPRNKWLYIRTKNGEILKARYLEGPKEYEGWYVKNDGENIGRIYPQKELEIQEYSEDGVHYKKYHSRKYRENVLYERSEEREVYHYE